MKQMIRNNWARTPRIRPIICALLAVTGLLLVGCDEQEVRAYEAPKSEPYVEPDIFKSMTAPRSASKAIGWDVPAGWAESANASSILFAVYEAKSEAGDARITVTKLRTDGGGVLANINRWRGQVGLGPVDSFEAQPMTLIQAGGGPAGLIDIASPEGVDAGLERMMVVMVPRPQDGLTWYFKMTGPKTSLDEHKAAFVSFVESVRFEEKSGVETETAAGDAPETEAGADTEGDSGDDSGGTGE